MTPGGYIRMRREAAGLSIGDVLAVLAGGGVLSAPLEDIEAGHALPTGMDAALLNYAFAIDDMVLARMKDGEPVQLCSACGCSEGFECQHEHWGKCALPASGVCTNCGFQRRLGVAA